MLKQSVLQQFKYTDVSEKRLTILHITTISNGKKNKKVHTVLNLQRSGYSKCSETICEAMNMNR